MSRIARIFRAFVVALAIAGVAALGTLIVIRARTDAMARANGAARDRARAIAQVVHDSVAEDVNSIVATTRQPVPHLAVVNKNYFATRAYLYELISTHPRLVSVAIYDAGGKLVVRIPDDPSIAGRRFGQQEYFRAAHNDGAAHISNLFVQLGQPKVPVIAYSIRIYHRGGIYGVLVGTTAITQFDSLVAPYTPASSIVRIYNASGERISPSSEASGKIYTTDPTVGPAIGGRSSVHRAGGSIIAAEPVAEYNWAVVLSQPARLADASLHKLTVRLSWLAGAASLLATLAIAVAWRRSSREG